MFRWAAGGERSSDSGTRTRLRDPEMKDKNGNLVARAPRAAVGIQGEALLSGAIVPTRSNSSGRASG